MPVIIVGADTPDGDAIATALIDPGREVRVFVSDENQAAKFRSAGAKVALGDVSDDSHIEAAAARCFTAVLVTSALYDGRELAFAKDPEQVLKRWANAVATVQRVIWVHAGEVPSVRDAEVAVVDPGGDDLVARVVSLDDAREI